MQRGGMIHERRGPPDLPADSRSGTGLWGQADAIPVPSATLPPGWDSTSVWGGSEAEPRGGEGQNSREPRPFARSSPYSPPPPPLPQQTRQVPPRQAWSRSSESARGGGRSVRGSSHCNGFWPWRLCVRRLTSRLAMQRRLVWAAARRIGRWELEKLGGCNALQPQASLPTSTGLGGKESSCWPLPRPIGSTDKGVGINPCAREQPSTLPTARACGGKRRRS